MKALKTFFMLCCCMAAVTFTSCLNDNDDNQRLTPEERMAAFQTIKGGYTGKLIYAKPNPTGNTNKNDTLDVNWRIDTDSTLTIANFPSAPLAAYITNEEISGLIAKQPAQSLKCLIGIYDNSPVKFLINPKTLVYDGLEYGGKAHKLEIVFYINNTYSFGGYDTFSNKGETDKTPTMFMQILIGGIYVDGQLNSDLLRTTTQLIFAGKK